MFTAIERANVQFFLLEYLKKKFNDADITVYEILRYGEKKLFSMKIKTKTVKELPKQLKLVFNIPTEVIIEIKPLDELQFEVIIKTKEDFMLLLERANMKACGLMNMYFTGPMMRDWQVHRDEDQVSSDIRIFQVPGIRGNDDLKKQLSATIWSIVDVIADHSLLAENKHVNVVDKLIKPETKIVANSAFEGELYAGVLKGRGGIFLSYKGYLKNLVAYHIKHGYQDLRNIEFFIERALHNSCFQPSSFVIEEPLEPRHRDSSETKEIETIFTMTVRIIVSDKLSVTKRKLPDVLVIESEDKSKILIKVRCLGTENDVTRYKFMIGKEALDFLREQTYCMARDCLNKQLQYVAISTSGGAKSEWHRSYSSPEASFKNICLRMSPFKNEIIGRATQSLMDVIVKMSGGPYSIRFKGDLLKIRPELGGMLKVVRGLDQKMVCLEYSDFSLSTLYYFTKTQTVYLHLSLTPSSQPDELKETHPEFPIAYASEKLDVKPVVKREVDEMGPPVHLAAKIKQENPVILAAAITAVKPSASEARAVLPTLPKPGSKKERGVVEDDSREKKKPRAAFADQKPDSLPPPSVFVSRMSSIPSGAVSSKSPSQKLNPPEEETVEDISIQQSSRLLRMRKRSDTSLLPPPASAGALPYFGSMTRSQKRKLDSQLSSSLSQAPDLKLPAQSLSFHSSLDKLSSSSQQEEVVTPSLKMELRPRRKAGSTAKSDSKLSDPLDCPDIEPAQRFTP